MTAAQYTGIGMLAAIFLAIFLGLRSQIGTRAALEVIGTTICVAAFLALAVMMVGGLA